MLALVAVLNQTITLCASLSPAVPIGPPTTIAEPTPVGMYADEGVARAMDNYQRIMQQKGIPRGVCVCVCVRACVCACACVRVCVCPV